MKVKHHIYSQGHRDFVVSDRGEIWAVVHDHNHNVQDGNSDNWKPLETEVVVMSNKDGVTTYKIVASVSSFLEYITLNKLLSTRESYNRSQHALETFKEAEKLFPSNKEQLDRLNSKQFRKEVSMARTNKILELQKLSGNKNNKQLFRKLTIFSNCCAGVQNTKNLTEAQAHTILQYIKDVNPSLILGCK